MRLAFVGMFFLALCTASSLAEDMNPLFDARLNLKLLAAKKSTNNKAIQEQVGLVGQRTDTKDATLIHLRSIGFVIPTYYDDRLVFTARVPLSQIQLVDRAIATSLLKLSLGNKISTYLDVSVPLTFSGGQFSSDETVSRELTGAGVIIGIVDTGIDIKHADFGGRVTRYWNQPAELYGTGDAVCSSSCCACEDGHGTHVASTAAGRYGVAPDVEIRAVETTFDDAGIIDGVNWLIAEAQESNSPIVINLSLGTLGGSHDGLSYISIAFREAIRGGNYMGEQLPGVALVISSGNAQNSNAVKHNTYTSTGESRSFDVLVANTASANNLAYMEMYAPWDDIFVVSIVSPSGFPFTVLTNSSNCLSNTDGVEITVCAGQFTNGDGSAQQIQIVLGSFDQVPSTIEAGVWQISLTALAFGDAEDHTVSAYIAFSDPTTEFLEPDSFDTLNDLCAGEDVIAVGAYISKFKWRALDAEGSWTDTNGDGLVSLCELWGRDSSIDNTQCIPEVDVSGHLAAFSSQGPTRDGRMKPDITAAGSFIAAAAASNSPRSYPSPCFDADQSEAGWDMSSEYAYLQGTSMSSPHVAGAVALLLQIKPDLTTSQILDALMMSAMQDEHTAAQGQNAWGAGKINLGAAIEIVRGWAATPTPTPTPIHTPVPTKAPCVDNDKLIAYVASEVGLPWITSCHQLSHLCFNRNFVSTLMHVCPRTCLVDNDSLLAELACNAGYCKVTSCAQVSSLCSYPQLGYMLRGICGETCSWCAM